jgi:hypothetical protein
VTNWLYSWSSLTHILNFHSTCWHPIRQSTCLRQSIEQRNFYQRLIYIYVTTQGPHHILEIEAFEHDCANLQAEGCK